MHAFAKGQMPASQYKWPMNFEWNVNALRIHVNSVCVRCARPKRIYIMAKPLQCILFGISRLIYALSPSLVRTIELILSICTTEIHVVNLNFDDIQWMFWINARASVCGSIKSGAVRKIIIHSVFVPGFSCQPWFPIHKIIEYTGDCKCACASTASCLPQQQILTQHRPNVVGYISKTIHWMHRFTNWCLIFCCNCLFNWNTHFTCSFVQCVCALEP